MVSTDELPPDVYEDDLNHPIPFVGKVDVAINIENGGYHAIVVSKAMENDVRTRARLLKKFDNYLEDFHSEEFKERCGGAFLGKLKIYVFMRPGSDPGILELLESCRPWLEDNDVELHIRPLRSKLSRWMSSLRRFLPGSRA